MQKLTDVEEDLINFGDRDDEFLDPELKQKALAFAIITAVVGFAFSSFFFLGQRMGPAAVILDRKAAEGKVVTGIKREAGHVSLNSSGFHPPRIAEYDELEERDIKPVKEMKAIGSLEDLEDKSTRTKPKKVKVADTSLGVVPEYLRDKKPAQSKPTSTRPKRVEKDLSRLLFPINRDRPERGSLSSVEMSVQQNLFVMANLRGEYQVGIGIDATGKALISNTYALPEYLSRVWVDGTIRNARVLGQDPELGLALIQIEGKSFHELPLAPAPPSRGERLLAFAARGKGSAPVDCRSGMTFGKAGFFVGGGLGPDTLGAPLLNDRGELVGCHVHSLPAAPGSGFHLASNSAALSRLIRGYQGSGSIGGVQSEAVSALGAYLAGIETNGETKRGRVLPGIGLSDFHLGMKPSATERWLSTPKKQTLSSGVEIWTSPAPPVTLYFVDSRLALAASRHTGFSTPDGLAPGVSVVPGQLTSEYPEIDFSGNTAVTPGLDVIISQDKIYEFVVKPEIVK
jgi:trypsin-like peptidase